MQTQVVMPQMGESLSEGTLTKWLKKVGDRVERDEPLFEISTDKVDTEVPSPASGVLEKILVEEGQTVAIETVVALIASGEPSEATAGGEPETEKAEAPAPGAPTEPGRPSAAPGGGGHFQSSHQPITFTRRGPRTPETAPAASDDRRHVLSPAVVSLAAREGIPIDELTRIAGTGAGGRITRKDVQRHLERRTRSTPSPAAAPSPAPYASASLLARRSPESLPAADDVPAHYLYRPEPDDTVVPMSSMRQQIAEHMVWSQRISPQVTSFTECDMHRIVRYRDQHRSDFEEREGIPLTFLPFVAEATVKALKEYPIFNASVLGDQIVMKKHIHLGIAVALDEGLMVPVIRNADEMNFVGLARMIHSVAERARTKRLRIEDVQGATFTITNPGMFGGLTGTPMIAQPQVAILGLGAIQKKPVVIDDAIAIRPVMVLALTFDHRIIDGALGFQFIESVRVQLEHFEIR